MSIYFSKNDPLGVGSAVSLNFDEHCARKTHRSSWGSNKHARKLFPRGKAYDKLWNTQFDAVARITLGM